MTDAYPKAYLYKRVVQAKLFIDAQYTTTIDLNEIAGEALFSKFHFIRLFKKSYGKTPHQYLTGLRIEKAMKLLQENHSVSETCSAVGFESLSSFSSLFRRQVGQNPSAYLAQQQELKTQITKQPFRFVPGCYAWQNGWNEKADGV